MNPRDTLAALADAGITLYVHEGQLKCRGRKAAYTTQLRDLVDRHRTNFLANWRCTSCGVVVPVLYGIQPAVVCRACTEEVSS